MKPGPARDGAHQRAAFPPGFCGGLIEAISRRFASSMSSSDSPPAFAGASLKHGRAIEEVAHGRHSPPAFAGASLKPQVIDDGVARAA